MNKTLSSLFRIVIATIMFIVAGTAVALRQEPDTVQAVGDLTVTFPSSPFFSETNMAPGDMVSKSFDVDNNGTVSRFVAVRAHTVSRSPVGSPDLDDVLSLEIKEGATTLHSFTSLKTFLDNPDGVVLSVLGAGNSTSYTFIVDFPTSAGNEYQGRSVEFDLTVGAILGDNVVINEVFYHVDSSHGTDCNIPTGNHTAQNINTGPNSTNIASVKVNNKCFIKVKNTATVAPSIVLTVNTGGNTVAGNTNADDLSSGSVTIVINLNTVINQLTKIGAQGQSDEWIELFNPTDQDISLKDWVVVDDSGIPRVINANKTIKAGKFALLVKSASTFSKFWKGKVPKGTLVIELGLPFGDGLHNDFDCVLLFNKENVFIDSVGWGEDPLGGVCAGVPQFDGTVPPGHSIERLAPGLDTDAGDDFEDRFPPTPGT
jgi:hypothetical protein